MESAETITQDSERLALIAKAIAREVISELQKLNSTPIVIEPEPPLAIVNVGPLVVDTLRHQVTVNGQAIDLKPQEFALLLALARGAGRAFSRQQLLDLAWSPDASIKTDERTVDVHVRRLRAKLGTDARILQTICRIGYKLEYRR